MVARLLNTAVSAGKRARSETSISKGKPRVRRVDWAVGAVNRYVNVRKLVFTPYERHPLVLEDELLGVSVVCDRSSLWDRGEQPVCDCIAWN